MHGAQRAALRQTGRRRLSAAAALLVLSLASASAASSSSPVAHHLFTRDPELDASLPELLARPVDIALSPFDVQLQLASAQCRELTMRGSSAVNGVRELGGSEDSAEDAEEPVDQETAAAYCKRVRYVRQMREKLRVALHAERRSIERAQQREQDEADRHEQPEPQAIATRNAGSLDLQEFFESYAETARPVVLISPQPDASTPSLNDENPDVLGFTSDDELAQFRAACFGATPPHTRSSGSTVASPLKIHEAECVQLLERFRVPVLLVHDYLRRTNVSLSETYLPSLVRIVARPQQQGDHSQEVVGCPHGLHMLAMVFPDRDESQAVDVHVFDQRFEPLLQQASRSHRHGDGDVEEVAISATSGGVLDNDGLRGLSQHVAPLYHTQKLRAHSFVFVPGSQFATLQPSDDAQSSSATTTLLRFCFVDASNFNVVKQEVAVEALVDSEAQTLLQSLQSQAFDRSMFRRPALKDSLWTNFVAWPKETKLLKKSELLNSEAGSEQLQLSRRERLKQWQDDKRWDRRVESLTLPVALPPVVVNVTRSSATLRFQDLYDLPKHDITAYGYIVRWKDVDAEQAALLLNQSVAANLGSEDSELELELNAMNITRRQLVRSALPTALFGDDFDGKDIEAVVSGLQAETRYTFTVQIYVDDTSGLESESSRIVQTTPCSEPSGVRGVPVASESTDATCVALRWLDPVDDGGKRVGLYLINARVVEGALDALVGKQDSLKTVEDEKVFTLDATYASASDAGGGAWKSAQVCKLVPGATYLFRVAAMNSIGAGPWSSRSDPVVVMPSSSAQSSPSSRRLSPAASASIPTLKGKGDPDYIPMRSFSMRELSDLVASHGPEVVIATLAESSAADDQQLTRNPRVVLSDVTEKIVIEAPAAAATAAAGVDSDSEAAGGSSSGVSFDVWSSHFSPRSFHVSSEIVRADPLDASTPLRNAAEVKDRVVLATRGGVPFVFKAHYAQLAGALGIVIADVDDMCEGRFDQRCVPGADKSRGEGFAAQDRHALWSQNRIPCVLALHSASQRLLALVAAVP